MFEHIGEPDFDMSVYKYLWMKVQKAKKKYACDC